MNKNGININFYLLDGAPDGRIRCTIANWTGVAYKIPRMHLEKFGNYKNLQRSGIYFLFGKSYESLKDMVYIGQADARKNGNGVLGRLFEHNRNFNKVYWTEALVFTTSNDFLGATEINWLENHFYNLAKSINFYEIKNINEPFKGNPKEEIISDLESFAHNVEIMMFIFGHMIFEQKVMGIESKNGNAPEQLIFFCKRKNISAKGRKTSEGFVVLAGSSISLSVADYVSKGYKDFRERRASSIDKSGILLEDVVFNSPSAASTFVFGYNSNGLIDWKTEDGKTLKEIEAAGF